MDDLIKLGKNDALKVIDRDLIVNGRLFKVVFPNEPFFGVKEGKLITIVLPGLRLHPADWEPEEIEGHYVG